MKAELTRFHIESTDEWLGHSTADTIWEELTELERLAEIGRAFEKSYNDNYRLIKNPYNTISNEFFSIEELLNWAKEDK